VARLMSCGLHPVSIAVEFFMPFEWPPCLRFSAEPAGAMLPLKLGSAAGMPSFRGGQRGGNDPARLVQPLFGPKAASDESHDNGNLLATRVAVNQHLAVVSVPEA